MVPNGFIKAPGISQISVHMYIRLFCLLNFAQIHYLNYLISKVNGYLILDTFTFDTSLLHTLHHTWQIPQSLVSACDLGVMSTSTVLPQGPGMYLGVIMFLIMSG